MSAVICVNDPIFNRFYSLSPNIECPFKAYAYKKNMIFTLKNVRHI